ncbi:BspA family leucine-rich repeat surface protein [Enterococcus hulanensis]|uniref:BspA family leucine-rich repeat surface protein n=1 Tax=Enterococcus hulanensis TaxID=2559929 RepID=UPI0010F45546|nr:BspA family leucine-rich repeat surface protein [Enterococcus hulanensis]
MKKSKFGILISLSLMTSILTPMDSLAEQLSDEQIIKKLETDDSSISDEDEIPVDEEIEKGSLDEILEIPEAVFEGNTEDIKDDSRSRVIDKTIVDFGRLEFGEWILYSDGQLYLEGVVTKEASQAWKQHSLSIKSILFSQSELRGDFRDFFTTYENVESIDFGVATLNSVTSMTKTFSNLKNLKKVSIRDVHHSTSLLENVSYMFSECSSLTELDVSGLNTSEVTNMNNMFNNCRSLSKLDVSGFDTGKVTNMGNMFSGCSGLTELDVSRFDTSKVTNMGYMFYNCRGLTELDVSGFDTSKVTTMSNMFNDCSVLTELDVNGFATSEVTTMSYMFYNCGGLTELDVSGFNTGEVTTMSYMFYNCNGLIELDVSEFSTSKVTTMSYMFYNCNGLTKLDVSGFNTSEVTTMSYMFQNCNGLTELDVSRFDTGNVMYMGHIFRSCSDLTELDVSGFDTSKVIDMNYMFYNCSGLTELDVSGFDTSKVTNMSHMFRDCSGLINLDASEFDTSKVTNMGYMFYNCSGLTKLDVSGFNTSEVTTMSYMFSSCRSLTEISVSKRFKFGSLTNFPLISSKYAWQEENNKQLFFSSDDMIAYHNDSDETNTYRKVAYVELVMDAKGGKFNDDAEKTTQIKAINDLWEEQVPTKENYQFDGWYLDEAYTEAFDFSKPATKTLTIFAKWVENYTVTILATINLNSEDKMTITGVNNGSGTLKINLKETESQINNFTQLRLTNKQDEDITTHTKLSWGQLSSDFWNVLTIDPKAGSVSKSAEIQMTKPDGIQAGEYKGQMVFSIKYE